MADKKKKLAMVVFSGDMDKLFAAFTIATGAAASNMDVTMFFTFWGEGCWVCSTEETSAGQRRAK